MNRTTSGFAWKHLLGPLVGLLRYASFSALALSTGSSTLAAQGHTVREPAAQEYTAAPITAEQFLLRLEAGDPHLERLLARLEAAQADLVAARRVANPTLAYNREQVANAGESLPEDFVLVEFPLDLSGQRPLRIRSAQAEVDATAREVGVERERILIAARDLYDDAVAARLRVEALHVSQIALGGLVEHIRQRVTAGDVSGLDLDRFELEMGLLTALHTEATLAQTLSERRLGHLVGEHGDRYQATDSLPVPDPRKYDSWLSLSDSDRDEHKTAVQRLEAAEAANVSAADRTWVPTISLTGGWKSAAVGAGQRVNGYVAAVSFEVPLFTRNQAQRTMTRALASQAQAGLAITKRNRHIAIDEAYQQLVTAIDLLHLHEEQQMTVLDRLTRRVDLSYLEGEVTPFEVLDTHRAARDVRLRHVELRQQARRAESQLCLALGRRP